jgi:alpha-1,2-mannosyltransferase
LIERALQEIRSETPSPARSFAVSLLRPTRAEFIIRTGIVLWAVFNLVVLVLVWFDPSGHSVVGNYLQGALGWWTGRDIFGPGIDGFLYLPSFAILYSPFAMLGEPWGDILWRIVSVAALTYAVWRAARLFLPARALEVFGTTLLLILPAGGAALRNGQATTLMLALMLLGVLAVAERRWWPAAILLALALAVKPLAIVLLLLAGVLYRPLAGRLLLCVALVLLLPLIHPDPAAAWHLYGLCLAKLFTAATPDPRAWSDITGVLSQIGLVASLTTLTLLRLVTALATLAIAYVAVRRQDSMVAAFDLFALAVCYLMLMNPRTEENTYIMLAAVIGFFAALAWQRERRISQALLLAALCVAMGTQAYGNWIYRPTVLWLKPLLCLGFLPFLIQSCFGWFFGPAPAPSDRTDI